MQRCGFHLFALLQGSVTISTDHLGTSFDTHINLLGAAAGDPTVCPGVGSMFEYGCNDDGPGTISGFNSILVAGLAYPGTNLLDSIGRFLRSHRYTFY